MVADQRNDEDMLRQRAIRQVKKRRDFYGHLLVFVLVNGAAIAIWATVGDGGFFWPIFLLFGWGIGLIMNAWDVFFRSYEDEAQIQREIERLRRRSG
jgi:hypothetical protein